MDSPDLDGKVLYFEMHTHPPDKSALYFTKGWARINALSGGYVTVSWPDYLGAKQCKVGYFETRDCRSIQTKRFRRDIRGHARQACESRFYLHRAASAQGVVRANIVLPVERAYLASMFKEGRGAQV